MKTVSFTQPDGQRVDFSVISIVRVRAIIYADNMPGNTRIDTESDYYVMEMPETVAAAIANKLPTLVEFRQPTEDPVWVNAREATGPLRVTQSQINKNMNSCMELLGYQFVADSHQFVYDAINLAGGNLRPIPPHP